MHREVAAGKGTEGTEGTINAHSKGGDIIKTETVKSEVVAENERKKAETLAEKNERKKEYLRSYQRAVRWEREILDEIQRLRESKMFPALALGDGMPKGGGGQADLAEYAAILDGEIEKLKQERLKRARLYRDIEDRIRRMTDDNEQRVLRLKYIQGLTWDGVCDEMGRKWTQVHRFHARALKNFKME